MICKTCEEDKLLDEFPRQRVVSSFRGVGATSVRKHCKACTATKAREFRSHNPGYTGTGKVSKYPKQDRLVVSACAHRVHDAKARSKAGLFDIDTDYMFDLLQQQGRLCAVSGIELSFEKHSHHVLSIDQIIPGLGYTKGNVQWVSWAVNRAKGDLSQSEFLDMCRAILRRCNDYPAREYSQVVGSA